MALEIWRPAMLPDTGLVFVHGAPGPVIVPESIATPPMYSAALVVAGVVPEDHAVPLPAPPVLN